MKNHNLKALAVAIPLCLWAGHAASKSIVVTGSIEAVSPKIDLPTTTTHQAFVSPLQLEVEEASNSGCRITGDPAVAMADHGDELVCLFEWTKLPDGMSAAGLTLDGYLTTQGNNEFEYQIVYFSGSLRERVVITNKTFTVNALPPIAPSLEGVKTTFSHGVFNGLTVTNYNKATGLEEVTANVESRDFRQVVTLDGFGSCVVPVGDSFCSIRASNRSVGNGGVGALQGSNTHEVTVDAENGYFAKNGRVVPEDYVLGWDYRSPIAEGLVMQARSEDSAESMARTISGVDFVVENEQAKLVVSSPHFGKPGNWWVPEVKLELKPDPSFKPTIPVFEIDGVNRVELESLISQPQKTYVLNPFNNPTVSNGKYVYTFDLNSVDDGFFVPHVSLNDAFDNKDVHEFDAVSLDRQPPTIQLMYKGNRFVDEGKVYFFEDMTVLALDTFDGGAEIVSVKVNGTDLEMVGDAKFLKELKAASLNLTPHQKYPLEITVRDSAGNTHTEGFVVNYMPMDFEVENSDVDYYQKVQRLDMDVNQIEGDNCPLYGSEEDLGRRTYTYGESQRCYLEWTNLPEGTAGSYTRGQHSLTGNLKFVTNESTSNEVGYRVWMIDSGGNKALAAEKSTQLQVKPAPIPSLTITQKDIISDNFFPVELDGDRFSIASTKGINADLELTSDDGTTVKTTFSRQRNGRFTQTSAYQTLQVGAGTLWDRTTFNVMSNYSLDSSISNKETVETVYVPSRRIRSRIITEDLKTLDTLTPKVAMKLGIYNSSDRDFNYDRSTMGEWKTYLAIESRDKETRQYVYTPITDKVSFEGPITEFDLDVSEVGYGSYRFIGVADLVSPVDGYTRRVLSNSNFYRVLKGGAIDGELKTYRISSPVPFTASVQFEPEQREDREALGDVVWEISVNGIDSWEPVPDAQGSNRLRRVIDEAAHYFIRATVTNKLSGAVRTTDILEILGYEIPDLKVFGPAALYEGEKDVLTVNDHGEVANDLEGLIEWSFDGVNWEEGTAELEVVGTGERMQVWSRMSYFNNEIAGNKRFDIARHRISVKKPKPVSVSVITPRIIEAGVPVSLNAVVRLASSQLKSDYESQWILPDGTKVLGNELTYTPTEADAKEGFTELRFQAWVSQLKEDTISTKDLSIRTWEYEFPEFRFDVFYSNRYAPVSAQAVVRKLDTQPVTVNYTYEFQIFDGMEVTRESNNRVYFMATKPGIHQFNVVIRDDRGNEKTMTEIMEVLNPPETKVTLSATYSTEYMREPLDASVRTRVELGHPDDRVATYSWYLDDELLPDLTSSRASIDGLEEGEHTVKAKVVSKYGIEQEELLTINVAPNSEPVCNLSYKQYGSTINAMSGCKDSDGKLSTHNWYVDGEIVNVHANNVSVIGKPGKLIHFRVVGFDDSGDTGEASLEVTPK